MSVKKNWDSNDFDFVCYNCNGQGGGILSVWNKNLFNKESAITRDDCIITQGKWLENNSQICFINVYASQSPAKRAELWQFLTAFIGGWQGSMVIFGDFNDVRAENERRGSKIDERATRIFNDFIVQNNLIDAKIGGSNYT